MSVTCAEMKYFLQLILLATSIDVPGTKIWLDAFILVATNMDQME
jgi:hypothetical protein